MAGTVTVSNTGKLNLQARASPKNGTLTNGNQVNVTGTGNTLDHETSATTPRSTSQRPRC